MTNPYRQLPSLDKLLARAELQPLIAQFGREAVRDEARALLDAIRSAIRAGEAPPSGDAIIVQLQDRVREALAPSLIPVINATGVIVHTNLGRALLSEEAKRAMIQVASSYSNLEYDLAAGKRGSRYIHAEALLTRLSGAEAALVVNNNAAAVNLVLRTLAAGREVIISRGELVEIGGGFRIPDILAQSGATLVEVGTTNRTRLADYARAISEHTGLLLKVHQSNYRIIGFTEEVEIHDLVGLARRLDRPLPVVHDLGSGTFLDTRPFGLAYEPRVQDSIAAGADVVTFSGDKLLGGPQAGIILGRKEIIARLKRQPLTRAFRVDKTTLAALQATLLAYLRGTATEEIPVWRMISTPAETLAGRARAWADALAQAGVRAELRPGSSAVGGGSLPGQTLPTTLLALPTDHPHRLLAALRAHTPPVIARVEEDAVVFDPRTVLPEQETALLDAIKHAMCA
ncbi:MAG TPA: L-seryl-tRNA(Sec) selenium transferase [Anaerolineae bacterium]|nr:L-seryl-tRNA(Sec) selenium transferase [Anaerolineae bacterium]